MAFIVSGAPFTHARVLPCCKAETVDIRFKAEENWNRRRMLRLALWATTALAASSPAGMGRTLSEDLSCQPSASRVVFSIGSPTMVPSSRRTRACAAARTCRVSGPTSVKLTRCSGLERLNKRAQQGERQRRSDTNSTPTTPSTTRFSAVMVPVLSKQQMSTRPAKGIRKGSVQKMAGNHRKRVLKGF